MKADQVIHVVAGLLVITSVSLGAPASFCYVSTYFLWVTVFVGANLLQSGFTGFCLLETILRKTGICKN